MTGHHGIVPLPVLLIYEWNPVSPTDHDYEELTSQRNSINEQHLNTRPPITRTMSGNEQLIPKFGHRARNNSMPLFPRKERRPIIDHEYDEPICNLKKTPTFQGYQNGCMAKKNAQNKAALLLKSQSSPAKRSRPITFVVGPQNQRGTVSKNSKTKDYEVPVSSADQAVERARANSSAAILQPSPSLSSLRLNKAKTTCAAKQGHQNKVMMYRSGSVGMESSIRAQLKARKCSPNGTGSSSSDQDDAVC